VKKDKGKSRSIANNWFNFGSVSSSRTSREIHNTVQGLLRDLIQDHVSDSPAAVGILNSCADACETHGLSFSDILQQRFIESRTPLYWAIVKRLPDDHPEVGGNQGPDLLTALISYVSPLQDEIITEIRHACLATSDQKLFQRFRQSPGFARMSAVDQMLLGVKIPPDEIEVEELSADENAFRVNFVVPQFHKRMAISKNIPLEFIARGMLRYIYTGIRGDSILKGRLWNFTFLAAPELGFGSPGHPPGSWCISLSLQECSPPTHVDSRLLILEAAPAAALNQPNTHPAPTRLKQKALSVRLQTKMEKLEAPGKYLGGNQILAPFDNVAAKLQRPNNPYIGSDEKLQARLEARLGKPGRDNDCIVC
jgi:hypothetical protein